VSLALHAVDVAPVELARLAAIDEADHGRIRWLIVERSNNAAGDARITRIEQRAWRFAQQLFAGVPLAIALESAADSEAPAWLAEHLSAGRFVAFSLADASEIPRPEESLR